MERVLSNEIRKVGIRLTSLTCFTLLTPVPLIIVAKVTFLKGRSDYVTHLVSSLLTVGSIMFISHVLNVYFLSFDVFIISAA